MKIFFRYSVLVKVITAIGLGCLFLLIYVVIKYKYSYIGVVAILLLLYPIITAPVSLMEYKDRLVVNCLLCRRIYRVADYDINYNVDIDISNSLRVFGSSGYFGYTGFFWKKGIGIFRLIQTSSSDRYIEIINKKSKKIIFIGI